MYICIVTSLHTYKLECDLRALAFNGMANKKMYCREGFHVLNFWHQFFLRL